MDSLTKDTRLEVKIRNNLILRKIEALGYQSLKRFAEDHPGVSYSDLCQLVALSLDPFKHTGVGRKVAWRQQVLNLSDALGCEPDDLFTDELLAERDTNRAVLEINAAETAGMLEHLRRVSLPPDEAFEAKELPSKVSEALDTIASSRTRDVLCRIYGLNGHDEEPVTDIARSYNLTPARIYQIRDRGLRQLRRRKRAELLKDYR